MNYCSRGGDRRRFHALLVKLSDNQRLVELYTRGPLPLMPSPLPDPEARRTAMIKTLGEHREIARLIWEQRPAEAIERLQEHLHQAPGRRPFTDDRGFTRTEAPPLRAI